MAITLGNLARVARGEGDLGGALVVWRRSLALSRALEDRRGTAECLDNLAELLAGQGQAALAARLLGAADVLRAAPEPLPWGPTVDVSGTFAAARELLGAEAFAADRARGRALPLDRVLAELPPDAPAGDGGD